MAKDIIDIALAEVGYSEQGENKTKYGAWYGMNGAAWCHMFASWCANQAGCTTSVFPKAASTTVGMQWFKDKGLFKLKGSYTPKRGDVIYFKTNRSHVGLVEKVQGSTVYTIEGNSGNKVARRSYHLSESTITGYGVPKYPNLNITNTNTGEGSSKSTKKTSETELQYLRNILYAKGGMTETITNREVKTTNKLPQGKVSVLIDNGSAKFLVPVKDGMKLVLERKGSPGKLTFEFLYNSKYKVEEGNAVLLTVDGTKMFYGFVFTKDSSKDGFISITAYDQLRYLKNKETLVYTNKTASEVIKIISERFNLQCGTLVDTKYKMSAIEDDTTLFDMIQNTLDNTMMVKNKVYVLFDNVGKITLKSIEHLKVNSCLIDDETGEDYSYKSSIDSNVYNQIKLVYENTDKGTFDIYVAKDSKNINKWGVLQYLEKIDDPDVGKLKSNAYLKLYNQKVRNLTVDGVIGNTNVRAGSLIPVLLTLTDVKIANYMLVEKVTHTFKNSQYSMDLILSGGGFSA